MPCKVAQGRSLHSCEGPKCVIGPLWRTCNSFGLMLLTTYLWTEALTSILHPSLKQAGDPSEIGLPQPCKGTRCGKWSFLSDG